MAKPAPEHVDILGQPLQEGCHVAMVHHNSMKIGRVIKLNPKMLRIVPLGTNHWRAEDGYLVYSNQTVRLDGPDALAYILRASN
jgi:hypothetical protein